MPAKITEVENGWKVVSEDQTGGMFPEYIFNVLNPEGNTVARTIVRGDVHRANWAIQPAGMAGQFGADEARARACAFEMAADELERLSA